MYLSLKITILVIAVCKTTLACTTLGSASAMLTIVMDVKNYDTERANVKPQYCERNDSRSRYMDVRSTCKIYWQGANIGAGVDGFEKKASQITRRPCAQPVNFCLECLFIIKLLETQMKSRRILLWELSEVKICWWLQKTKGIFL